MLGKALWRLASKLLQQRLQRGIGSLAGDARLQEQIDDVDRARVLGELERKINISAVPGEPRGHHAYDGVVLVVQLQLLSQHGGTAAEMAPPELPGEHCDWLRLLPIDPV